MINQQTAYDTIEQDTKLGTLPPNCRFLELQVSPTTIVYLIDKSDKAPYKTRTLLDSGSGASWCHVDLLQYVKYNDLGSITMQVQVFEGLKKKRYEYVYFTYLFRTN